MKRFVTIAALAIAATGMVTVSANAQNANRLNPLPFSVFDMNNDGAITRAEFDEVRAKRQAASGGEGRNQANAPTFETIDANGDGTITHAEFMEHQAENCLTSAPVGQNRGLANGHTGCPDTQRQCVIARGGGVLDNDRKGGRAQSKTQCPYDAAGKQVPNPNPATAATILISET